MSSLLSRRQNNGTELRELTEPVRTLNGYAVKCEAWLWGSSSARWSLTAVDRFLIEMRSDYIKPILDSVPQSKLKTAEWPNRMFLYESGNLGEIEFFNLRMRLEPYERDNWWSKQYEFTMAEVEATIDLLETFLETYDDELLDFPLFRINVFDAKTNRGIARGELCFPIDQSRVLIDEKMGQTNLTGGNITEVN